nr:MAG TPA: hypothetical protein [Inoviridae sp.]
MGPIVRLCGTEVPLVGTPVPHSCTVGPRRLVERLGRKSRAFNWLCSAFRKALRYYYYYSLARGVLLMALLWFSYFWSSPSAKEGALRHPLLVPCSLFTYICGISYSCRFSYNCSI